MLVDEGAEGLRVGKVPTVEGNPQSYGSEVGERPEVAVEPREFKVL